MSTPDAYVASLERRIAQLEATVATLPQGEQAVPNYLSVDSAGNVSAVFTGGVLLPIGDAQANSPVNQARWVKRAADGSLGADIARLEGSWATGATPVSAYRETAISPTTGRQAYVEARASENANLGATGVTVNVATPAFISRTLLDGNGKSDFLQWNTGTPGLYGPYFCQALGLGAGAQQAFNVTLPSIPKGSSSDLFMFGACDPEGWGIARYHTPTPAGGPFTNIVIDLFNPTSVAQNIGWLFGLVNF